MTCRGKHGFMAALSLVLALLLAGCGMAGAAAPDGAGSPVPAGAQSPGVAASPSPGQQPVLEAYAAVLRNEAEFFSTDTDKNVYLNDFLADNGVYETVLKATRFAVLDMDGDGVPEVVLELSRNDTPDFYEILHAADGAVRGYFVVYRGLEELKADGSFYFSNGAADGGWGKMQFGEKAFEPDVLGYSESRQEDADMTVSYFIGNEPATKEAYDAFMAEQFGKPGAVWHEFSQQEIETELFA